LAFGFIIIVRGIIKPQNKTNGNNVVMCNEAIFQALTLMNHEKAKVKLVMQQFSDVNEMLGKLKNECLA
jgi:hypothetical protein